MTTPHRRLKMIKMAIPIRDIRDELRSRMRVPTSTRNEHLTSHNHPSGQVNCSVMTRLGLNLLQTSGDLEISLMPGLPAAFQKCRAIPKQARPTLHILQVFHRATISSSLRHRRAQSPSESTLRRRNPMRPQRSNNLPRLHRIRKIPPWINS